LSRAPAPNVIKVAASTRVIDAPAVARLATPWLTRGSSRRGADSEGEPAVEVALQ
jgi:hypothetical protein